MPYLVEQPFRETAAYFKENDAVVLGVGAIHAHDHIPQGIDTLTSEWFVREIEQRTEVLVAPTIAYGPMPSYMDYEGCISPRSETFRDYVQQVCDDLYKWGARKFFVVNGHSQNQPALLEIGMKLRRQHAIMPIFEWWRMISGIDPALDKAVNALPMGVEASKKARTRGTETAAAMVVVPGAQSPESLKIIYSRELFGGDMRTNFATGITFKGFTVPTALGSRETTDWGDVGTNATKELGDQILGKCLDYMVEFIDHMKKNGVPKFKTT